MFRLVLVIGVLSCVLPSLLAQSTQQIIYTHYDNSGCYSDWSQVTHTWYDSSCRWDHLTSSGPSKYITSYIINNSTVRLCVSDMGCWGNTNTTCSTYPTNQCMWDLSGASWRLSLGPAYPTPVPTIAPTSPPTSSPSQTIIFTHYNNRWCYDDAWSFSHSWSSGICYVDHLESSGNSTSIQATLEFGSQVELCQYSDANYHCDIYHYPQCDHYYLNTCYQTSNTSWVRFTTGANPYPTYPPTATPSPTPVPTTQPPPVLGKTVIYTTYRDRYCGIMAQPSHNWANGSCVMDSYDYYSSINIKPRIVASQLVELCFHYDNLAHCEGDFSSCGMYQTDTCVVHLNSYTSFRLQIYGANTMPTLPPTPTPTRDPTPNPNQPIFLYTHYDDYYSCTMVTRGYPRVWYERTINNEYLGGQVLPFNATLISPTLALVCLVQPSMTTCQRVSLNACVTGPLNTGQFMLQLINSTMIPTPTIAPTYPPTTPPPTTPRPTPTPYPVGAVNIIYTRYLDANCSQIDPNAGTPSFVNGECDTQFFNEKWKQVKANLQAGGKSVQVCNSDNDCRESLMDCRAFCIDECLVDIPTSLSYRYTLSGAPTSFPSSSSSGLSTGVLIGLIAGGVVLLVILVGIICYCRKHQRRLKEQALHMQQDGGYTRV